MEHVLKKKGMDHLQCLLQNTVASKWWSNIETDLILSVELNPDPVVPQSGTKTKGQDGGVRVSIH